MRSKDYLLTEASERVENILSYNNLAWFVCRFLLLFLEVLVDIRNAINTIADKQEEMTGE